MEISAFFYSLLTLVASGGIIDVLLLQRHKRGIHNLAYKYWWRLDDISIPDIPCAACKYIVKYWDAVTINKWFSTIVYSITAYVLICVAFAIKERLIGANWQTGSAGDIFDRMPTPHVLIVATIIAFDIFALVILRRVLIKINMYSTLRAFVGVACHIVTLVFLMILCVATTQYENDWLTNNNALGMRGAKREAAFNDFAAAKFFTATNKDEKALIETYNNIFIWMTVSNNLKTQLKDTNPISALKNTFGEHSNARCTNSFAFDVYQGVNAFEMLLSGHKALWIDKRYTVFAPTADPRNDLIVTWEAERPMPIVMYLLAGTLILPALVVVVIILFMFISKFLLIGLRRTLLTSLERLTDYKAIEVLPFTLLASAAGALLLLGKIVALVFHAV